MSHKSLATFDGTGPLQDTFRENFALQREWKNNVSTATMNACLFDA